MHWIGRHILFELTRLPERRYSELRPTGVEGNLFAYHLDQLLQQQLIEKQDRYYQLTTKGKVFVSTLSLKTGRTREQPLLLTMVVCCNKNSEHLFVRWHRQPNTGFVSLAHGMVHMGRELVEMAAIELAEKAGLEADMAYIGQVGLRIFHDNEIQRHMIIELFEASNVHGGREDQLRPEVAEPFWAKLEDLAPEEFLPGHYEIAKLVQSRGSERLFYELSAEA